jgi:hypothetical protein
VGIEDDTQGTIRCHPEAFLASAILVCEGASEVGFVRGLDQHRSSTTGSTSIHASGICLLDAGGVNKIYSRALPLLKLGYSVAVLRDDDKKPDSTIEESFTTKGGKLHMWGDGLKIEDEIFSSVCDDSVKKILEYAVGLHGDVLIDDHIKTASSNTYDLTACRASISEDIRKCLAKASTTKNSSWFKNVSCMEHISVNIIAPNLNNADDDFQQKISNLFEWADAHA